MYYVIGHKNPDTDSVISALVLSHFLNKIGKNTEARVPGKVNKETEYVFSYFNKELPEEISEISSDDQVFLVDHNDLSQSLASEKNVYGVLDHHLLSGIKTDTPIYFRVEIIGSTASLVYKLYKETNIDLDDIDAKLLLSAIISDTLNLTSPTTTNEDKNIYQELKEITNIDTDILSQEMFAHKSDYSDKVVLDIVMGDLKEFDFGSKKVVISVAETTNLKFFNENSEEVSLEIKKAKKDNNYDYFFFAAIDIINKNTHFFPADNEEREIIEKIFQAVDKGDYYFLENIVSRKKDIAPVISKYFS